MAEESGQKKVKNKKQLSIAKLEQDKLKRFGDSGDELKQTFKPG